MPLPTLACADFNCCSARSRSATLAALIAASLSLALLRQQGVLELRLGIAQIGFGAADRELKSERIDLGHDIARPHEIADIDFARYDAPQRAECKIGLDPGLDNAGQAARVCACSALAATDLTGRGPACSPASRLPDRSRQEARLPQGLKASRCISGNGSSYLPSQATA